ncbi:Rib/alpha-like domain-containing protein [Aerococcus mictus]|uniref:Rib/alpha-like domain-containing protein n=1 Tax=Aerococcus mictus TaxID=2976810 RepID=UPI001C0ED238|nr:Rib/alpha-like domain-containing protein [Aerococcus urinae]MBU5611125.1 YSIRK-type signal peptide-containing protein [Aerococcus urinae]MDK8389198.1 Rib/alpha-like domain-containing protein [Aerococcus urinae]
MVGKNNLQVKKEKRANKFYRYSIKRLSVGVASVAVAAGLLFAGDAAVVEVAAAEVSEESSELVLNEGESTAKEASSAENVSVVKELNDEEEPDKEETAPVAEAEEVPVEESAVQAEAEEEVQPRVVTYAAPTEGETGGTATRAAAQDPAPNKENLDAAINQEIPFKEETFGKKDYEPGNAGPIRYNTTEVMDTTENTADLAIRFWPFASAATRWGTVEGTTYPGRYVISFENPDFYQNIASVETTRGNMAGGQTVWVSATSGRDWTMPLTNANLEAGITGSISDVDVRVTLKEGTTFENLGLADTPLPFTVGMVTGKGAGDEFNLIEGRSLDNGFILRNNPNNPAREENPELYAPHGTIGAIGDSRFADGNFYDKGMSHSVYYDEASNSIISRHTVQPDQNFSESSYSNVHYFMEQIPKVLVPYIDKNSVKIGVMNDVSNPNLFRTSTNAPIDPIPLVMNDSGLVDSRKTPAISIAHADSNDRRTQIQALQNARTNINDRILEGTLGQPRTYSIVYPLAEGYTPQDIAQAMAEYTKNNNNKLLFETWVEQDFVDTPGGPLNGQTPYADNGEPTKRLVGSYGNAYFDAYYELSLAATNEPQTQLIETEVGSLPDPQAGIANAAELPEGTTFTWETEPDVSQVTPKDEEGNDIPVDSRVKVTYLDGSSEVVHVPVVVREASEKDADKYEPTTEGVTKDHGQAPTEDEVKNAVSIPNFPAEGDQPTVTVDDPSQLPDGQTPGTTDVPVTVTYPDGSEDKVNVPVTIAEPTEQDADKYEPTADTVTKEHGQETTEDDVKNAVSIPDFPAEGDQPTVTVDDPGQLPDGQTPGKTEVPVTVTYPDGSEDKVNVPVTVKEAERTPTSVEGQPTTVKPDGMEQETGLTVSNQDEATPTSVSAKDEDGQDVPAAIDENGNIKLTPSENVDGPIAVTVSDEDLPGGSQDYTVPVENHAANQDDNGSETETAHVTHSIRVDGKPLVVQEGKTPEESLPEEFRNIKVTLTSMEDPSVQFESGSVWVGGTGFPVTKNFNLASIPLGEYKVTIEGFDPVNSNYEIADTGLTDGGTLTVTDNLGNQFINFVTKEAEPTEQDADKYTPTASEVTKDYGQTPTEEEIKNAVSVPEYPTEGDQPTVTVDDPSQLPDGQTPGTTEVPVTVTYPDGSEDKLTVPVTVKDQPAADKYEPTAEEVTKEHGEAPSEEEIKNAVNVPDYPAEGDQPTVTVDDPNQLPDGQTPGTTEVPVTVTYPDGTEDKLTVPVTVKDQPAADKYELTANEVTKDHGQAPTEEEIKNAVNVPDYPTEGDQPTVTVDDPSQLPDGQTPGTTEVPVTVTYPDGSEDKLTVAVTVEEPKTEVGGAIKSVDPTDEKQGIGITVTNPDDTTTVTATDEDGKEVPAEINPETGEVEVTPGTDVDGPIDVVIEDEDLPKGKATIPVPVNGHEDGRDDNVPKTEIGGAVKSVDPSDEKQGTGITVTNPTDQTTVTATDEDGKKVPAEINPETGEVEVTPGTDVDGPINVVIEDEDLPNGKATIPVPVNGHEDGRDDNGSEGKPATEQTRVDDSKVNPVDQNDDQQSTGITIVNPDDETKVSAKDEDGKDVPVEVVTDGRFGDVKVTPGTDVDGPITITIEDPELPEGKQEVTVPVIGHEAGRDDNAPKTEIGGAVKPVHPSDEKQGTGITVTNPDDTTTVTATDEDGKEVPAEINPETGEIEVTPGTDVDGPIRIVIEDEDLPRGKATIPVQVIGHEAGRDDNKSEDTPADEPTDNEDTSHVLDETSGDNQNTGNIITDPDKDTGIKDDNDEEDHETEPASNPVVPVNHHEEDDPSKLGENVENTKASQTTPSKTSHVVKDNEVGQSSEAKVSTAKVHSQLPQTGAVAGLVSSLALVLIGAGSILAVGKRKK